MRERRASQENKKGKRKSKTRRLSVTLNTERTSGKVVAVTQEEESMDVDSCLPTDQHSSRSKKEKEKEADVAKRSVNTTLRDNNRVLATALEDAQLELRLARHENVQLRKQFYESHQSYVEKTSELESQLQSVEHLLANNGTKTIQAVFQNVYKLLNQTCEQLLQASNSLADAVHLVRSYLAPSKVQKDTSPHVIYNNVSPYVFPVSSAVCTTPPLDEPSAMEITESQSVIIEINDTIMNNLNREQKAIHVKVNNDRKAMEGTQSQRGSQRTKRKCCTAVSYIEPGLRSKLRSGDPFTDSTLFGEETLTSSKKRKKSLPTMRNTKKRSPLANLTNIIPEES